MTETGAERKKLPPGYFAWSSSREVSGFNELPTFLAGTPVAVLAGFALATAVLVISQRPASGYGATMATWSATFLLIGAAVFLATLALSARAQFVAMDPEQARIWFPQIGLSEDALKAVRKNVWRSQRWIRKLVRAATVTWTLGLILNAVGAALGVLSYKIDAGHVLAACAFGVGTLVVAILFLYPTTMPKTVESVGAPDLAPEMIDFMLGRTPPSPKPDVRIRFADGSTVTVTGVNRDVVVGDGAGKVKVQRTDDGGVNIATKDGHSVTVAEAFGTVDM